MTRKIHKEEFVAGGIQAMYEIASQEPSVEIVPNTLNVDEETDLVFGPTPQTEDFWNKITEDDQFLSYLLGQQVLGQIIDHAIENYGASIKVTEPYNIDVDFTPSDAGYSLLVKAMYGVKIG